MKIRMELPVYGIVITITGPRKGTIKSMLTYEGLFGKAEATRTPYEHQGRVNAGLKAIELMILGHMLRGVDLWAPGYIEGIKLAVDGVLQEYA